MKVFPDKFSDKETLTHDKIVKYQDKFVDEETLTQK